jgi:Na+-translocating ferredoxin:NAD+ oxidoreductase RnfG subunit
MIYLSVISDAVWLALITTGSTIILALIQLFIGKKIDKASTQATVIAEKADKKRSTAAIKVAKEVKGVKETLHLNREGTDSKLDSTAKEVAKVVEGVVKVVESNEAIHGAVNGTAKALAEKLERTEAALLEVTRILATERGLKAQPTPTVEAK